MCTTTGTVNKHLTLIFQALVEMPKRQTEYLKTLEPSKYEEWLSEFKTILTHCEVLLHTGEMTEEDFYKILLSGIVPVEWHPMALPIVSGFGLKGAPSTVFM